MAIKKSILVIGSNKHSRATKCIDWGELVYVGDYDHLIINTASLTKNVLQTIIQKDSSYFEKLRKDIIDVQQQKGIALICIFSPYALSQNVELKQGMDDILRKTINNYSWSPIIPLLEQIPTGEKLHKEESLLPKDYVNKIKGYSLLFESSINNTGYVDKSKDGNIYTKCHYKS